MTRQFPEKAFIGNRSYSVSAGGCPISRLPAPPTGDLLQHAREFGTAVYVHQPDIDRVDKMADTHGAEGRRLRLR